MKHNLLEATEKNILRLLMSLPLPMIFKSLGVKSVKLDGNTLHPEIQLYLLIRKLTNRPAMGDQPPVQSRLSYVKDSKVHGAEIPHIQSRDFAITPDVDGRLYSVSPDSAPVIVYYHGGGFVIGDNEMFDHVCKYICAETGFKVFAVNYRKAPEFRFPIGIEDAVAGYRWALEHSHELNIDTDKIYVAGDSAGGCLATVVTQVLASKGEKLPLKQLLFYPTCDWVADYKSTELFSSGFFLTKHDFEYFAHHLHGGVPNDVSDFRISPLRGKLSGLPPAIIVTAGFDPLRDQGDAYAAKMKESGVDVTHLRAEGMIHGFINLVGFSQYSRNVVSHALSLLKT